MLSVFVNIMSFKPCNRFSKSGRETYEEVINRGKFEEKRRKREGRKAAKKEEGMMRKRTKMKERRRTKKKKINCQPNV